VITLRELLEQMVVKKASDLHLTAGVPPEFRIDGSIIPGDMEPLAPEVTAQLAYSMLSDEQRKRFETTKELDLSFGIKGLSRFRANIYLQRGCISAAIRQIPFEIRPFESLGLPPVVKDFCARQKGLVLVCGPTGSGKSTTLAAMIDHINSTRQGHIVTIEDPIEYVHHHRKCIVNQREVGSDTNSFATALKYVLRQDPDVVLVGEMRDLETIETALNIADTAHLVFATLHTNSSYEAISRIVDVFPPEQQRQVQVQIAFSLVGVLTQQLIPKSHGAGRAMATEVLVCTPAIRAVIREGKTHQIYSLMQAGQKHGNQTMNQALLQCVQDRSLTAEDAMEHSTDPLELESMLRKVTVRAA
jgi:twitching motility protein PilT